MNSQLTPPPLTLRSKQHESESLLHRLLRWAQDRPDALAYMFLNNNDVDARSLTFAELHIRVRIAATALRRDGVRPGDRIILLCEPGLDFIMAFLGCLWAGVIAVPVQPPRKPDEISRLMAILHAANTNIVWMDDAIYSHASALADTGQSLRIVGLRAGATPALEEDFAHAPIACNAVAFLQFTSGSTGTPRGVMVTHANLAANQKAIRHAFGHDDTTTVVSWLPHYHDMGLVGMLLQPLYIGRPCYFMSPVVFLQRPVRWLQAISRCSATTSGAPNFGYELCIRGITDEQLEKSQLDLSKWRVAYNGAEPIRAETLELFARRFAPYGFREEAFLPCYGMAEATLLISGGPSWQSPIVRNIPLSQSEPSAATGSLSKPSMTLSSLRVVSCGHVAKDHDIVIVDTKSTQQLQERQMGEIWIRGPSVTAGYWHRPQETTATFLARLPDGDGPFLRTGDIGFVDNGELFITGRLKSLIIVNGRNLFPADIENAIRYSHVAFRPQCAVIDLRDQSDQIVVLQEVDPHAMREYDSDALKRGARKIASNTFGIQAEICLITSRLPLTSSGKLRREACRSLFLDGQLRQYAPLPSENV